MVAANHGIPRHKAGGAPKSALAYMHARLPLSLPQGRQQLTATHRTRLYARTPSPELVSGEATTDSYMLHTLIAAANLWLPCLSNTERRGINP